MKEELKALEQKIKTLKQQYKASQRLVSAQERIMEKYDYSYVVSSHKFKERHKLVKVMHKIKDELFKKQCQYRAEHIYRSILRGKSIIQIEPKHRENDSMRTYVYLSLLPKFLAEVKERDIYLFPNETLRTSGWMDKGGQYRLFSRDDMRRAKL